MGAQLVKAAYVFALSWPLKPNEFRLLAYMALTAKDTDAQPRYFAARESSALALGRRVEDAPHPDDPRAAEIERDRSAAFARVKVATSGLVRAGAIKSIRRGREGQRAEYALLLRPVESGPISMPRGSESDPLGRSEYVPLAGSNSDQQHGRKATPQGTSEEPPEDRYPGTISLNSTTSLGAVDSTDESGNSQSESRAEDTMRVGAP